MKRARAHARTRDRASYRAVRGCEWRTDQEEEEEEEEEEKEEEEEEEKKQEKEEEEEEDVEAERWRGRGAHTIEDNAVAIFEPAKYLGARCCSVLLSALALPLSFFGSVHVPPKRSDSAPMTHGPDQTGGQRERKRAKEREREEAARRARDGARERRV